MVPISKAVEVLVVGGGPAGIAAAVAAAREGANTLLVERYGYLGGMVTGAHVVWVLGMGDGFRQIARGIARDIRDRLEPLGAVKKPNACGDYTVDPEVFKWQAIEMLGELGATVLLHTMACDPIVEDGAVRGVFTESKAGRRAIRAKIVIDASADGDVAFRAGCGYDNETHDVSLGANVDGVDKAREKAFAEESPDRFQQIRAEAIRLNGGAMVGRGRHLKNIDVTDPSALTEAETVLRRDLFAALRHLRAHMPGWEKAVIRETLPQLGVRQSRRIHTEYMVTDADLRASRHFDDSVARLGSYLLGYKLYDPNGLDYDVPYRCMVPREIDGLLLAGRCVGSDYLANNTLRLIAPCFATGQAAGIAAALAARQGVAPRNIPVRELQNRLVGQGAYLAAAGQELAPLPSNTAPIEVTDS
ncbi:MAG: FAD-dependent oxidoreductase [Kiritimatiellae bacterium]|nr:FAD-dependent oxidoreductase [Kiritimatiellia bacterium]